MKCQKCKGNLATNHFEVKKNKQVVYEAHVCAPCAPEALANYAEACVPRSLTEVLKERAKEQKESAAEGECECEECYPK